MTNTRFLFFSAVLFSTLGFNLSAKAEADFKGIETAHHQLIESVTKKNLDCAKDFEPILKQFASAQQNLAVNDAKDSQKVIEALYSGRLELKEKLDLKNAECLKQARTYFFQSRSLQDRLYILSHQDEQKTIKSIDFLKIDVPQLKDPARTLLNPKISNYELRPGDIMIAKGISFTSSTISQLPVQPSQFSHIALFVQHEGSLHTLESYIGKGVDAYKLDEALKNENARILILRPKDASLAKTASETMQAIYATSVSSAKKIKYDYKLDMKDHSELTCAEVAVTAFEKASQAKVVIPEFQSTMNFANDDFVKTLGLRNGPIMMPDDMEFDSRFDTVLEWSEYTLLQDSLRKDQIMNFLLKRINHKEDILNHSYKSKILSVLWKTRDITWLWPLSAKILGLAEDFDAGVPLDTLKISLDVDSTGQQYLKKLYQADTEYFKAHQQWMSEQQLAQQIEKK